MKKSELRSDPEKVREWQDRSRKALTRSQTRRQRYRRLSVPQGIRNKVRIRSGGWCVACLARNGVFCAVGFERRQRVPAQVLGARGLIRPMRHIHHVLPVQRWAEWELEIDNMVGVCAECHDEHERAHRRIPYEALPVSVRLFAQNLGGPEALYIEKTYPKREVGSA